MQALCSAYAESDENEDSPDETVHPEDALLHLKPACSQIKQIQVVSLAPDVVTKVSMLLIPGYSIESSFVPFGNASTFLLMLFESLFCAEWLH